jgi:hypothetical protein
LGANADDGGDAARVDALVAQLKLTQAERKAAGTRVAELEGIDLDIRASRDHVEKLKETWQEWSKLLDAHDAPLPDGTYGAAMARSILRKILVSPIVVTPVVAPSAPVDFEAMCAGREVPPITWVSSWRFRGYSRFDSVIRGGLAKGEVSVEASAFWSSPDVLACMGIDETYNSPHPISGGSDAPIGGVPDGRGPEMAPHTPAACRAHNRRWSIARAAVYCICWPRGASGARRPRPRAPLPGPGRACGAGRRR